MTYALAMEELGRADSALRGIVSVSSGLVGKSILFFGTEEQKHEWLPSSRRPASSGCFGLTEPDTGSDAGNLTSRAVARRDDWVLNGQKLFITNGTWADVALIFARTSDDGPRGVTAFLVPTDTPGSRRARSRASSACAARPRPSCSSPTSGCPRPPCWARWAAASRSR